MPRCKTQTTIVVGALLAAFLDVAVAVLESAPVPFAFEEGACVYLTNSSNSLSFRNLCAVGATGTATLPTGPYFSMSMLADGISATTVLDSVGIERALNCTYDESANTLTLNVEGPSCRMWFINSFTSQFFFGEVGINATDFLWSNSASETPPLEKSCSAPIPVLSPVLSPTVLENNSSRNRNSSSGGTSSTSEPSTMPLLSPSRYPSVRPTTNSVPTPTAPGPSSAPSLSPTYPWGHAGNHVNSKTATGVFTAILVLLGVALCLGGVYAYLDIAKMKDDFSFPVAVATDEEGSSSVELAAAANPMQHGHTPETFPSTGEGDEY